MALALYTDSFFISPYAFSAFVALTEKGVPFEVKTVWLSRKEHHRPEYVNGSITGRIPALEHDGFWLAESGAIIEYLEEAFPPPGYRRALPEDRRDRARARMVMHFIRSDLMALRDERPTTTMFYERASAPLSPAGQAAAERLQDIADRLVPDGATALFGAWCAADADLAFMLHRLLLNGHEVRPKLRAFAEAQWRRPSVQAWVDRNRPPLEPY